jgi:ABC-type transport system involved in multi-copper enzyme maturation permease subunit
MKYWQGIFAIANNTYREIVRDRIMLAFVLFACLITVLAILLGSLSVGQDMRILLNIGVSAIGLMTGFIAIFAGANLVYKELERRTVYIIFTKPVAGAQFILGKYFGLCSAMLMMIVSMGLFLTVLVFLLEPNNASYALAGGVALAIALIYLEIILITALATFFSSFASPMMSVLFSLSLWFIAHLTNSLHDLGKMSQNPTVVKAFDIAYWVLPDLAGLTKARFLVMYRQLPNYEMIFYLTCYVFAYVLILLLLAAIITERKEFT